MDSTLFDYKSQFALNAFPSPKGHFQSSGNNSLKTTPRPFSASHQKLLQRNITPTANGDIQNKHFFPPMQHVGGTNRIRPATTTHENRTPNPFVEASKMLPTNGIEELAPEEEVRIYEKVAQHQPTQQIQDIQRLMPRTVTKEKEKMYEEILHLKQNMNVIKEESSRIKARNLTLEKENAKLIKSMERIGNNTVQYGKTNESALVVMLKKQVNDLKDEMRAQYEELEIMRRNTKVTKFQELEIELKAYVDENVRLRGIADEAIRARERLEVENFHNIDERYYQNNGVEALRKDNLRLGSEIKYLDDQLANLQVSKELDGRTIQRLHNEIAKLKKTVKEKDMLPLNFKTESTSRAGILRAETKSRAENDEAEMRRNLEQRDQLITQQEKAIEDLRSRLNEKASNEMKERQNHLLEMHKIKDQYNDLESRYRALLSLHNPIDDRRKIGDGGRSNSKYEEDLASDERSLGYETKYKKVKRLMFDDVSNLGYELSLKMMMRRIPLKDIMRFFDKHGEKLTIYEMKNILSHDPFRIKDDNVTTLLARYLIEPNEEEVLVYDANRSQDVTIIKSVFRKLVRNYTLLTEDEDDAFSNEFGELIHKFGSSLQTQFSMLPESKTGFLSSESIMKIFNLLDLQISPKSFEYLLMNLYEYTNTLKALDYRKMFEIFETEEHKRLKKIIEKYQNQNRLDSESNDKERRVRFKDTEEDEQDNGENEDEEDEEDCDDEGEEGEEDDGEEGEEGEEEGSQHGESESEHEEDESNEKEEEGDKTLS